MRIPISDQIITIKKELEFRERVYPKRVEQKIMTKQEADREIARIKAVLQTLKEALETKRSELQRLHKGNSQEEAK